MKQVLQYAKRGQLKIEELPAPALKAGGVVIANQASLLSAGTEKAIIEIAEKSLLGKARQRPDLVKQVIAKARFEGVMNTFRKVKTRLDTPVPLGYSCAGVVTEVSPEVSEITVGQRLAAAGFGYATHSEQIFVPKNLTASIPDSVSMEEASFVTVGAIALQGVRQANPTLGETIAVIGMGLLGQLTAQMLRANGCRVIAMDIDDQKLRLAETLGCKDTINNSSPDTHAMIMSSTGGVGVDRVIVTAASSSPAIMKLAAEIARDRGHVTVVGAVNMELERKPYYDKELSLNLSRSYGPGRYDMNYEEMGHDYPIGYVRWTERRNMECFLQMIADGRVSVKELITHRFTIDNARAGFDLITGKTAEPFLGVVLNYPESETERAGIRQTRMSNATTVSVQKKNSQMILGAIGAGNFSTGALYPILKRMKSVALEHLVATNGMKASSVARQFGFATAGTSVDAMLDDSNITAVLIATPHNLHAEQVVLALQNGKDVFVEKPLATTTKELKKIAIAYSISPGKLMVGFNRRFAPASMKVKDKLAKLDSPSLLTYRINAGFIPKNSPLQSNSIGKGRIIGEVCHFVDLLTYLTDSTPTRVYATGVGYKGGQFLSTDNAQISLTFADGSTGLISYVACGGAGLSKEYLEAHCQNVSFVIDDFKSVRMYKNGTHKTIWSGAQDKGHAGELEKFVTLRKTDPEIIGLTENAITVTKTTFAIVESMRSGEPVII